jgi:hypothetical protein
MCLAQFAPPTIGCTRHPTHILARADGDRACLVEHLANIVGRRNQSCPSLANRTMATFTESAINRPGNTPHIARKIVDRNAGRQQRAGALRCLDNEYDKRDSGNDAVAPRKEFRAGKHISGLLRNHRTSALDDRIEQ